jgi:hypothetical protein
LSPSLRITLERHMQFELTGVHHAAQPDTEEASAFRRMQEKRLRHMKQVVALAQVVALGPKMSVELFHVGLAHVQDASREVNAVRQINSQRSWLEKPRA